MKLRCLLLFAIILTAYSACQKKSNIVPEIITTNDTAISILDSTPPVVITPPHNHPSPPYTDTFLGSIYLSGTYWNHDPTFAGNIEAYVQHLASGLLIFTSDTWESYNSGPDYMWGSFYADSSNYYSYIIMGYVDDNYNYRLTSDSLVYNSSHYYCPDMHCTHFEGIRINKY